MPIPINYRPPFGRKKLTLSNYIKLIKDTKFGYWYKNTIIIAVLSMLIGVVFVFSSLMGMIAMFALFQTFNLLGRPIALAILYVGGSIYFNVWLIKRYLQQIPRDLDESSMLDGANKKQILFKIILLISVPILLFVAVS